MVHNKGLYLIKIRTILILEIINYKEDVNWETTVHQMTQGKGADVIVETV